MFLLALLPTASALTWDVSHFDSGDSYDTNNYTGSAGSDQGGYWQTTGDGKMTYTKVSATNPYGNVTGFDSMFKCTAGSGECNWQLGLCTANAPEDGCASGSGYTLNAQGTGGNFFKLHAGDRGDTVIATGSAVVDDTWYNISWRTRILSNGSQEITIYRDGTLEINTTNDYFNINTQATYYAMTYYYSESHTAVGKQDWLYLQYNATSEAPEAPTPTNATFNTTVTPIIAYAQNNLTCTSFWNDNGDVNITQTNLTQTWTNNSVTYSQQNITNATSGTNYTLTIPNTATTIGDTWACTGNWTYTGGTDTDTITRVIQNAEPTITGNFTYDGAHTDAVLRNFTCTDPDENQNLTLNITFQDDFREKTYYDLSSLGANLKGITKDSDGNWYVIEKDSDKLYKFYANWTNTGENWSIKNNAGSLINPGYILNGYNTSNNWVIGDTSFTFFNCLVHNSTELNCTNLGATTATTDFVRDMSFSDMTQPNETTYYTMSDPNIRAYYGDRDLVNSATIKDINANCDYGSMGEQTWLWKWGETWLVGEKEGMICKISPVTTWASFTNTTLNNSVYANLTASVGTSPAHGWQDMYRDDEYYYGAYDDTSDERVYVFYPKLLNDATLNANGNLSITGLFNYTGPTTNTVYDTGVHQVDLSCSDGTTTTTQSFNITLTNTPPTTPTTLSPKDTYTNIDPSTVSYSCTGQTDADGDTITTQLFRNLSNGPTTRYMGLFQAFATTTTFSYLANNTALTTRDGTLNIPYYHDTWSCRACDTQPQLPDFCSGYPTEQTLTNLQFGRCSNVPNSSNIGDGSLKTTTINFTFEDEVTYAPVNGTANVYVTYTCPAAALTAGLCNADGSTAFANSSENPNYDFCYTPTDGGPLLADWFFHYDGTDYEPRTWEAENTLTENMTTQILYMLKSADGMYLSLITQTAVGAPVEGVHVVVEKLVGGVFTQTLQGDTDGAGALTFWLLPGILHRFTFTKTGYQTVEKEHVPSVNIPQVFVQMTTGAFDLYTSPIEGFRWYITPQQGLLNKNTFYNYTFDVYADNDNLKDCRITIYNNSGDQVSQNSACTTNTTTGSVSTGYTTGPNPGYMWGRLEIRFINSTGNLTDWINIDADLMWTLITAIPDTYHTLTDFLTGFKDADLYSEDAVEAYYSRIWFIFLLLAILITVFTFTTGEEVQNPMVTMLPLFAIFLTLSWFGYFTLPYNPVNVTGANAFRSIYAQYAFFIIFLSYFINYVAARFEKSGGGERI
jgi:hypothetical protein